MFIKFFKSYNLTAIRQKLATLYLLNLTDIIFTEILLATGYFMEANFLMRNVVDNLFYSIILKIIVPLLLIFFIYQRIGKATGKQLYISNMIVNGSILLYALINISHLVWSLFYLVL